MTTHEAKPAAGDLILRTRPGLNIQSGRKEPRYWVDEYNVYSRSGSYATQGEARAEGHRRAEAAGVALWRDMTSVTNEGPRVRLEVSFRGTAQ